MEEFVAYIIKNLVSDPESVTVVSCQDNDRVRLEINVANDDIGKVIGRRGNTIHALRTIVHRVSSRVKIKVQLELVQPKNMDEDSINFYEDEEYREENSEDNELVKASHELVLD